MQENNILFNNKTNEIVLIDFEYTSINFRGNDLASTLTEASMEYSDDLLPPFRLHRDTMVKFETQNNERNVVEELCRTYLAEAHKVCGVKTEVNAWI